MTVIKSLNNAIKEKNTKGILTYFGTLCKEHFSYGKIKESRCGDIITLSSFKLIVNVFNTQRGSPKTIISSEEHPSQEIFSGFSCSHYASRLFQNGIICTLKHREDPLKTDEAKFAVYGEWDGKTMYLKEKCRTSLKVPKKQIREITIEDIEKKF